MNIIAPCCDNPPHAGPCDPTSHRYRQLPLMRQATDAEIRLAARGRLGGLVELVERGIKEDAADQVVTA